jgi:IBR domain, a half RING-finger domain/RING-type zinc-finger
VPKDVEKPRSRTPISHPNDPLIVKHRVFSTQVVFGPGVSVERIILPYKPSHVIVSNLPLNATKSEVGSLFTKHRFQNFYIHHIETAWDGSHKTAQVIFDESKARNAAVGLDGMEFRNKKLTLQLYNGRPGQMLDISPPDAAKLHISWELPHCTAVVAYKDAAVARSRLAALENSIIGGQMIKIRMKRSFASKMLLMSTVAEISGLPVDADRSYIRDLTGASFVESIERTRYDLNRAYTALRREVDKVSAALPIAYNEDESKTQSGVVGLQARFQTWEQARGVRDKLAPRRLRYIGEKRLTFSLEDPFRYSTIISIQQYKAQERILKSIFDSCKDSSLARMQILSTDPTVPLRIEVYGSNKNFVGALKVRVEQVLAGERIFVWDPFFDSDNGAKFLDTISRDTGVLLHPDVESCDIRAFGDASRLSAARQALIAKLSSLVSHPVQLDRDSIHFFQTAGVPILTEIVGKGSVRLDVASSPPTIQIKGEADAQHILRGLVTESKNHDRMGSPNPTVDCPICFDSVTNPVRLGCGHVYCHGCIRHFLNTAADVGSFPLCCAACKVPLPIPVLRRFLSPPRLKLLLDASFYAYINNHPDEYRYCPTPSCSELYHVTQRHGNSPPPFDCPSCFKSLCSACHSIPHQGMTCEEWSSSQDSKQQDKMLEKWVEKKKEHVKRCPKCSVLIEKDFGCNHVKCRCGTHICWKCMQTFSSGIYDHLAAVHGGAFEH